MTDSEFDDILKKRIPQHESNVPADMWERIAHDKKKRRFGFILNRYVGTLILLLLVSTGSILFYTEQSKKKNNAGIISSMPADSANHTHKIIESTMLPNKNYYSKLIVVDKNKSERSILLNVISSHNQQESIQSNDGEVLQPENLNKIKQQSVRDSSNTIIQQNPVKQLTTNSEDTTTIAEQNENTDKISISIFASPDLPLSKITSADAQYENLLRNSIHMKLSYTLGIAISYHLNKRISLSTGIQYSRVDEVISFNDSLGTFEEHSRNHLSFIHLPFTITYNTNWTSSFQTSINAGILLNVSSNYKGQMPNTFSGLMDINKSVYKNNTGVSIYTGINFSKPASNKFEVFAEPYFRYQPKNIATNMQSFARRLNTAGVKLGVRYKLFKDEKK